MGAAISEKAALEQLAAALEAFFQSDFGMLDKSALNKAIRTMNSPSHHARLVEEMLETVGDDVMKKLVEAGKKFLAVLMLHYIHLCVQRPRCLGPTLSSR